MAVALELAGQNSLWNSHLKLSQSKNLEFPAFSFSHLKTWAAHLAAHPDFMYIWECPDDFYLVVRAGLWAQEYVHKSGRIIGRSCPWNGLHQICWAKPASAVWLRLTGQSQRWGFFWWGERVVFVVAVSRLVVVGESCLQVGQFVFGFLCTWLLIQRGPASRWRHIWCSWQMLAVPWKSGPG